MSKKMGSVRRLITARVLEVLLVIVLVGMIVWVSSLVQNLRRDILAAQLSLESDLSGAVQRGLLLMEFESREQDIRRIFENVPSRDRIADVISQIEAAGASRDVQVLVPRVLERGVLDEVGVEASPDPSEFTEVVLTISATGTAVNVLQFFHELEQLPYLAGVLSFSIQRGTEPLPRGVTASVPENDSPGTQDEGPAPPATQLTASFLLSTLPASLQILSGTQ